MADPHLPDTFAAKLLGLPDNTLPKIHPKTTTFKGEPAVFLSDEDIAMIAAPLRQALVGKFSRGRPTLDHLRKDFQTIGFKGEFTIGAIDSRHVLLKFSLEEDFHRCWIKGVWNFGSYYMRMIKWCPEFSVDNEPPIVPVWISLHGLPFHMFNKDMLFAIGSSIGRPLKIDTPTLNFSRPSVARLCVEIDLLKPHPKRIRLGKESYHFLQPITYENMPHYCMGCHKLGHVEAQCRQGKIEPTIPIEKSIWKPKPTSCSEYTIKEKEPKSTPINVANNVEATSSGLSIKDKEAIPTLTNEENTLKENHVTISTSPILQQPALIVMDEPTNSHHETRMETQPSEPISAQLLIVETTHIISPIVDEQTIEKNRISDSEKEMDIPKVNVDVQDKEENVDKLQSQQLEENVEEYATTAVIESIAKKLAISEYLSDLAFTDQELIVMMPEYPVSQQRRGFTRIKSKNFKELAVDEINSTQITKEPGTEPQQSTSSPSQSNLQLPLEQIENHEVQSEDDDFMQEYDDFIPVVSKKSRRRKDCLPKQKSMQTRQLPRKDYAKLAR